MTVRIEDKKLLIDGRNVEPKLQAEEAALSYKVKDKHYHFIELREGAVKTGKVAVHSGGEVKDKVMGEKALSQKIIFDEVDDLIEAAGHLRDRYHSDKNTVKLLGAACRLSSEERAVETDILRLREHVSMMNGLDDAFEEGLETIETAAGELKQKGYYTDEDIEGLLNIYVTRYLYPLEYKLQIKGYIMNDTYGRLQEHLSARRIKTGYFDQRRLKKHIDMMAGLEMEESPWIRILDENLKKPVSGKTTEENVISALVRHLLKQSKGMSRKMIYRK